MKGQSSVEMLVSLGAIFAFTIPVLLLLFSVTQYGQESAAISQTQATSRVLADAINDVYAQGPYAQKVILINIPSTVTELKIENNEVILQMKITNGVYDAASPIFAKMDDFQSIKDKSGLFSVKIKNLYDANLNGGKVQVNLEGT